MARQTRQTLTYTEVIRRLPYPDEQEYAQITAQFYQFRVRAHWNAEPSGDYVPVGWILPATATNMPWTCKFKVDHHSKTVDIPYAAGEEYESKAIAEQLELALRQGCFNMPKKLEEEQYRILSIKRTVRVPRGGSALLGIQTFGIQMTCYVRDDTTGQMKIWAPGFMDNTVGGGANADEDHLNCMLREAKEEASLPGKWLRENAKVMGTISYFFVRDAKAAGELGFVDRSIQFIYDAELPSHMIPKPLDGEVEEFYLWTIDQTVEALKQGRFKTNGAVTLIDFLIRHGHISERNEPELEIVISLIKRCPLPDSY